MFKASIKQSNNKFYKNYNEGERKGHRQQEHMQ